MQTFQCCDRLRKGRNGGRIKDVSPLHGGGHVQVVFDEEVNFFFLFRRKVQSLGGASERREAARNVILHGHSFAHVVQQQRQNQQVPPLGGLPQRPEMRSALIRRLRQFLQVLDGSQRMFIHGIAVIEIAHHQRVDHPEFRQDFRQQPQPLHRPQSHTRIIGAQNLSQCGPGNLRVLRRKFRMCQDITDAALRLTAQRSTSASGFREEGVGDRAVRQHRLVEHLEQAVTHGEKLVVTWLGFGGARCVEKALPQR